MMRRPRIEISGGFPWRNADNLQTNVTFPDDVSKCGVSLTLRGGLPGRTIRILNASAGKTISVFTSFVNGNTTTTTLDAYDVVWAAAGHSHAVFPTTYDELVRVTGGTPADVAAD